jgi:WD40-like Beta Propeller Repeat
MNLGPEINTKARDYSPRISGDGQWLYVPSKRVFWRKTANNPLHISRLTWNFKRCATTWATSTECRWLGSWRRRESSW